MPTKIFQLKQKVIEATPEGEMPWTIFGRLMVRTGIVWSKIEEDTDVSPEQMEKALKAVENLFGKKITV